MKKLALNLCGALLAAALQQSAMAQFVISDAGSATPTLGPNDVGVVYASVPSVQNNDGLNYYWDNAAAPGQTFTTGSDVGGYTLTNLSVKTGGGGGWRKFSTHGQRHRDAATMPGWRVG